MNGRIKELVARDFPHDCNGDIMTTPESIADFAELIVRECLDQCYYRGMNHDLYAGQLKAAEYIEQHFGVER